MKDHVFRELVNDLRNIAVLYHNRDSLRDKIGGRLRQDIQPDEQLGTEYRLTLNMDDVAFIAARVRRLCKEFNYPIPDKDDKFIVSVAGSLIGGILTNKALDDHKDKEEL